MRTRARRGWSSDTIEPGSTLDLTHLISVSVSVRAGRTDPGFRCLGGAQSHREAQFLRRKFGMIGYPVDHLIFDHAILQS